MTVTRDQIPTDLTLEIDVELTPDRFLVAARSFFGYVHEIARAVAGEGEQPRWSVRVKEGSALLAMEPRTSVPPSILDAVYLKAVEGIAALEAGDAEGSELTDTALKHLRSLSELSETRHTAFPSVRLWVRRQPIVLGSRIAEVIREDSRVEHHDYGTIEGRLEAIRDKDGSLLMQVRDTYLRQSVRCLVPEEMLSQSFASFRKRVEVTGVIHYRRNGTPVSIDAEKIEVLPEDSDLPTARDVLGILRATA